MRRKSYFEVRVSVVEVRPDFDDLEIVDPTAVAMFDECEEAESFADALGGVAYEMTADGQD